MAKRRKSPRRRSTKVTAGPLFIAKQYINDYPMGFFSTGVPLPDDYADLAGVYGNHVWAYACISQIAEAFSSLEFEAWKKDPRKSTPRKVSWTLYEKHPFNQILDRPNPFMSQYFLMQLTAIDMKVSGNSYWSLTRKGGPDDTTGPIQEIWPLVPANVRIIPGDTVPVKSFIYTPPGTRRKIPIPFENMIHHRYPNPVDPGYGAAPTSAGKLSITADLNAMAWNKFFFANNARPDAILQTDKVLGEANRKRMAEAWKDSFQGPEKRAKLAILENGLKYIEANRTPKDLDFNELRKMSREEVLAVYKVPPAVVGIYEYANYANSEQQTFLFWQNCILPMSKLIGDSLTLRLAQLYPTEINVSWHPDTSGIAALAEDDKTRAETAKFFVEMGVPLNAVISSLDLPFDPVEGGDVSRPAYGRPTDQASASGDVTPGEVAKPPVKPPAKSKGMEPPPARPMKPSMSDPARATRWKKLDNSLAPHETRMQLSMKTFFKRQKKRVKDALAKHGESILTGHVSKKGQPFDTTKGQGSAINTAALFDPARERPLMMNAADKAMKGAYLDRASKVFDEVRSLTDKGKKAKKPTGAFDMHDANAQKFLEEKKLNLAMEANDYTKEQIDDAVTESVHDALVEGFDMGETIQDISDRIDDVYAFADETRSDRIARTEIVSVSNAGSMEAMKQAGADGKEWLSSRDEKVRDTHEQVDGDQVGPDEDFNVGGSPMQYPGDPNGPVEEVVNCRCTVIPFVEGYSETDITDEVPSS